MEKKIRITLSKKILEILESDMDEFLIKKNTLLNLIYEKLKTEFSRVKINSDGDTQVIQFNLNKRNKENYYFFLEENNIQNESEFFRDIITYYALMRKKERDTGGQSPTSSGFVVREVFGTYRVSRVREGESGSLVETDPWNLI